MVLLTYNYYRKHKLKLTFSQLKLGTAGIFRQGLSLMTAFPETRKPYTVRKAETLNQYIFAGVLILSIFSVK